MPDTWLDYGATAATRFATPSVWWPALDFLPHLAEPENEPSSRRVELNQITTQKLRLVFTDIFHVSGLGRAPAHLGLERFVDYT